MKEAAGRAAASRDSDDSVREESWVSDTLHLPLNPIITAIIALLNPLKIDHAVTTLDHTFLVVISLWLSSHLLCLLPPASCHLPQTMLHFVWLRPHHATSVLAPFFVVFLARFMCTKLSHKIHFHFVETQRAGELHSIKWHRHIFMGHVWQVSFSQLALLIKRPIGR